jgi:hypothetical protein
VCVYSIAFKRGVPYSNHFLSFHCLWWRWRWETESAILGLACLSDQLIDVDDRDCSISLPLVDIAGYQHSSLAFLLTAARAWVVAASFVIYTSQNGKGSSSSSSWKEVTRGMCFIYHDDDGDDDGDNDADDVMPPSRARARLVTVTHDKGMLMPSTPHEGESLLDPIIVHVTFDEINSETQVGGNQDDLVIFIGKRKLEDACKHIIEDLETTRRTHLTWTELSKGSSGSYKDYVFILSRSVNTSIMLLDDHLRFSLSRLALFHHEGLFSLPDLFRAAFSDNVGIHKIFGEGAEAELGLAHVVIVFPDISPYWIDICASCVLDHCAIKMAHKGCPGMWDVVGGNIQSSDLSHPCCEIDRRNATLARVIEIVLFASV